jgi:hypothetical protein
MTLAVIGAGFGRTGTLSLKAALEQLGFGPCHHMHEVFEHPEQIPLWQAAADGRPVDWTTLLAGYRSACDWPSCHWWRELAAAFPRARVVLTVRPEADWWRSFESTIREALAGDNPAAPPHVRAQGAMARRIVFELTMQGRTDQASALAAYRRRREEVEAALPKERLLVLDVAEGWAPLCGFLGVPVPDTPFPKTNSTGEFRQRLGLDAA